MIEINIFAILGAGVVSMILGFLWYSPMLLGKTWMKEKGFTEDSLKKAQNEMGKLYGLSFIVSLITAFVLLHVMTMSEAFFGLPMFQTGLITACWMWVGFVMPVQVTATIFGNKNMKLLAIDSGFQLVSLLGMSIVLAIL